MVKVQQLSTIFQLYRGGKFYWWRKPTTLCDKVCQSLAVGRLFSSNTPVSSTNKTYHHDITEILLKVVEL
jgi:hypothetical protein